MSGWKGGGWGINEDVFAAGLDIRMLIKSFFPYSKSLRPLNLDLRSSLVVPKVVPSPEEAEASPGVLLEMQVLRSYHG